MALIHIKKDTSWCFYIILDFCFMPLDFNYFRKQLWCIKGATNLFKVHHSHPQSCKRSGDRLDSPKLTHKAAHWQWKWWPEATDWDWEHIKVAAPPPFQIYLPWIDHEAINSSQSVTVSTEAAKWKQNAVCSKASALYLKSVFCL